MAGMEDAVAGKLKVEKSLTIQNTGSDTAIVTGINIDTEVTNGINISSTLTTATGRAIKSAVTINNAALTDGYGANEFDLTLTGTSADHNACGSFWVNMATGTHGTGGAAITPLSVGIWEASAATITGSSIIVGMKMQAILGDNDPTRLCYFDTNISGDTLHAIFAISGGTAATMGFTADTSFSGASIGNVPFMVDSNQKLYYIRLYEKG